MVIVFPYGTCAICDAGLWPTTRPSVRRVICDLPDCRRAVNSYGARVRNAHARRQRLDNPRTHRRCPKCDTTKPLTEAHWYVDERDGDGNVTKWHGWCRDCKRAAQRDVSAARRAERAKRKREAAAIQRARAKADPDYAAELRQRNSAATKEWRRKNPEAARAIQRRYRERVKNDPARLQAQREGERIAYRLRRERDTGRLAERNRTEHERDERPMPRLPAKPFAESIDHHIALHARRDGLHADNITTNLGIEPRNLRAWRNGERRHVQFSVAHKILVKLDLNWWDIYPAEQYPQLAERLDYSQEAGG